MSNQTAIIIDDSSLARMMVRKIFATSMADWTLLEAANGDEALALMADKSVDLALVDFNMPGMNGIDLAERMMETAPSMSIHLVTANIQERMRIRAESMGLGFIKKPINAAKVAEIMKHIGH
ncbi:MAG: response regulator [Magnetococcales bacterium]|nr:response regulator [Magnetococcales bacterium]